MVRWVLAIVAGGLVAGMGVFLVVAGLDDADKWASVLGLFVAVAGLGLSGYGIAGRRRNAGGQSVTGSVIGGGVSQVRGVRGSVRIGHSPTPTAAPASGAPPGAGGAVPDPQPGPVDDGGQSVTRSWAAGPVNQVDGVGGDTDIDR